MYTHSRRNLMITVHSLSFCVIHKYKNMFGSMYMYINTLLTKSDKIKIKLS